MSVRDVYSILHKSIQQDLEARNWKPTGVQVAALPDIHEGLDRLVVAPTGSGKTMTAVLPLLSRCLNENWEGLSILYVTPLRALNRDVDRRLQDICESVGLRIGTRHGDTTQSERAKQVRKPPNMLVTTPETLQLLFTGKNVRKMISTVRAVVIDEVHDLAASERGWQLNLGLIRLEHLAGRRIQRVGLSATVGNPDQVAEWMSERAQPIIAHTDRFTELTVEAEIVNPSDEVGSIDLSVSPRAHACFRRLIKIIESDSPCLLFVNSRNDAETIAQRLSEMAPNLRIGVHHGSLAKETRTNMEDDLRNGEIEALVCTSSLELGIDVGSIKRVLQVNSPRSVDRMLQRVGRADHRVGGTGRGHLMAWELDEISEAAVIAKSAMEGNLEPVVWRDRPICVAANQLVLMAHSHGAVSIDEATKLLQHAVQFKEWRREDTENLLAVLSDGWILRYTPNPKEVPWYRWPKNVYGAALAHELKLQKKGKTSLEGSQMHPGFSLPEIDMRPDYKTADEDVPIAMHEVKIPVPKHFENGWFSTASRTRQWVSNNLSMIPDKQSYRVRDAVSRRTIGNVDEAFVLTINDSGEEDDGTVARFVMAGRTWAIVDADPEQSELLVAPVNDKASAPKWLGELPPVPIEVGQGIGVLRRAIAEEFGLLEGKEEVISDLAADEIEILTGLKNQAVPEIKQYPVDDEAMSILVEAVTSHIDSTGMLPCDNVITIERRDDALVLNSCFGTQINEAIGHFLLAMASTKTGKWGRLTIDSTRIAIQSSDLDATDVINWLEETPADAIEGVLSVTLPNSNQVRWRFAQVAKVLGILRHGIDPRRINLKGLLRKYRGTIVMEEVLGKLFHERMDVNGARNVIQAIQSNAIRLEITAQGRLGLSNRAREDMLLPQWDNAAVRERLRLRLMNERATLCCLKCHKTRSFRVVRYHEMSNITRCISCKGRMLACSREGMSKMLEGWVKSDDVKDRDRMEKNAQLVNHRGHEAVIALMGRGIGEATAQRLLRKTPRGNMDSLLEAIHLAEIEYARTRRFWS